jgi:general stress protein YciG
MTKLRGFAALSPDRRHEISSKGGRTAHAQGRAHQYTSKTAAIAGRKGGLAVSADKEYMQELARKSVAVRKKKELK